MNGAVTVMTLPAPPVREREIWRYAATLHPDETLQALLKTCLAEALPLCDYRVCLLPFDIRDGKGDLPFLQNGGAVLQKTLDGCRKGVLFAATIGVAFDRLLHKESALSPAKAVLLQAIGAERIEALCDAVEEKIAQQYSDGTLRPRVSPGYGDFALSAQQAIFRILDCPHNIGLSLCDSLLMTPSKSVTAVIGVKV